VDEIIESLSSNCIDSKERKLLGNFLRELKLHRLGDNISSAPVVLPLIGNISNLDVVPLWPSDSDIPNYLDLNESVSFVKMRRDLSAYLHYIINIVTEGSVGYKIYYDIPFNTPDESVEKLFTILIHTDDDRPEDSM
jgi:hypothetical protein